MTLHLTHIINPFVPPVGSDLEIAQPVTFETMRRARAASDSSIEVHLVSSQFKEDRSFVPDDFILTPDLERSVLDMHSFEHDMRLPILADILDRAYDFEPTDYIIYTNVDIAVQPHFYNEVACMIESGLDAFIINRRRISGDFEGVHELDIMYSLKGLPHPGFDCFVFKKSLYPSFSLANVCIGVPYIGITLAQNIFAFANRSKVFTDKFLTFHLGLEFFFRRAPKDYLFYNRENFWAAMKILWPHLDTRKWPHGHEWLLLRFLKWAINPSLPIRLAFRLEPRRYGLGRGEKKV